MAEAFVELFVSKFLGLFDCTELNLVSGESSSSSDTSESSITISVCDFLAERRSASPRVSVCGEN